MMLLMLIVYRKIDRRCPLLHRSRRLDHRRFRFLSTESVNFSISRRRYTFREDL